MEYFLFLAIIGVAVYAFAKWDSRRSANAPKEPEPIIPSDIDIVLAYFEESVKSYVKSKHRDNISWEYTTEGLHILEEEVALKITVLNHETNEERTFYETIVPRKVMDMAWTLPRLKERIASYNINPLAVEEARSMGILWLKGEVRKIKVDMYIHDKYMNVVSWRYADDKDPYFMERRKNVLVTFFNGHTREITLENLMVYNGYEAERKMQENAMLHNELRAIAKQMTEYCDSYMEEWMNSGKDEAFCVIPADILSANSLSNIELAMNEYSDYEVAIKDNGLLVKYANRIGNYLASREHKKIALKINWYLQNINEYMEKGRLEDAAINIRHIIELIINDYIARYVPDAMGLTSSEKIDKLREEYHISPTSEYNLHKLRITSNKGAHGDAGELSIPELNGALRVLKEEIGVYTEHHCFIKKVNGTGLPVIFVRFLLFTACQN